jgi:hypothetical protein
VITGDKSTLTVQLLNSSKEEVVKEIEYIIPQRYYRNPEFTPETLLLLNLFIILKRFDSFCVSINIDVNHAGLKKILKKKSKPKPVILLLIKLDKLNCNISLNI